MLLMHSFVLHKTFRWSMWVDKCELAKLENSHAVNKVMVFVLKLPSCLKTCVQIFYHRYMNEISTCTAVI